MRGTNLLQALIHDAMRQFGAIAFTAEMAQIQIPQLGRHDFLRAIRRGLIRQMPVTTEDSLLEAPRAARTFLILTRCKQTPAGPDIITT